MFVIAIVFVPAMPFQVSLIFVGKAVAYPIEDPFICSTLEHAPGRADKQKTRLKRLARDKH
jgi:hypothetical protein